MRNIKTTLRTVRNIALLFAAASGMTYLTACQETEVQPGNTDLEENVEVSTLALKVGTNPDLAKTYYNSHMGTRAAKDVPEHPGMPDAPTAEQLAAMNRIDASTNLYSYQAGYNDTPDFYIKGDVNLSQLATVVYVQDASTNWQQVPVTNVRYFIDGNVVVSNGIGGEENNPMEIHILKGGKLSVGTNIPYATTIYLYKGGDILKARNDGEIYHKGSLIAEEDLVHGDVNITIEGNVYTYGKIHGKNVTLIGGEVFAGCAVTAEENIYLTGDNSVVSAGYVSAPTIQLSGNSPLKIALRDGGYLHATENLNLTNIGNLFVYAEEGEYAMVETKNLLVNNEDLKGTMYNVAVKFDTTNGGTNSAGAKGEGITWNQKVMVNDDVVYDVVDGDSCAPKMVVKPEAPAEPEPDPVLEDIGSVAPADGHEHPISATCIFTNGQDAYLSWHTQGGLFHGCIEYLTVANGTVTLKGYLETNPAGQGEDNIDFNHVIFDNSKIFVAGDHQKKGGIIGWIQCDNGGFVTGNATLNMRQLYKGKGGSGNCIIRNGDHYQIASIKGFETYKVADFGVGAKPKAIAALDAYNFDPAKDEAKSTGKHIATDGQKVVMLTLINRDNGANTANASIKVYNASDVNYENEVASYVISDQVLAPVDGKDVIAIKGDDIWVCLGQGGVQHLKLAGNKISKVSEFVLKNKSKEELKGWQMTPKEAAAAGANGLAVDGKYVYVAHGGAGLVVLKKDDLSFVTRTRNNGGNSANYVTLNDDGYIYVAYGKSNVQVYAWEKN